MPFMKNTILSIINSNDFLLTPLHESKMISTDIFFLSVFKGVEEKKIISDSMWHLRLRSKISGFTQDEKGIIYAQQC